MLTHVIFYLHFHFMKCNSKIFANKMYQVFTIGIDLYLFYCLYVIFTVLACELIFVFMTVYRRITLIYTEARSFVAVSQFVPNNGLSIHFMLGSAMDILKYMVLLLSHRSMFVVYRSVYRSFNMNINIRIVKFWSSFGIQLLN